ncbi:hypothetical protein LC087_19290 (plasmid) [Bacillus carboniphilus]|uniref:Uncharacterized protein n=1 Tax=Bacillus carboniphilus TaxID=86663 RepID=A0ABY9K0E9_9BACI|nr:hypothetical protein [Bacillus carboniphilus]WLR44513.1 hypothetical protein LC087_19290 [Bacillus carboniphilus]
MKYIIQVEETLVYENEIEIEAQEGLSEREVQELIEETKRFCYIHQDGTEEFARSLNDDDIKVTEVALSFPESPRKIELEIVDVRSLGGDK